MTWPAIIILTAACVACAANAYTLVKLTIRLNAAEQVMRKQLEAMDALVDRLTPAVAFGPSCTADGWWGANDLYVFKTPTGDEEGDES